MRVMIRCQNKGCCGYVPLESARQQQTSCAGSGWGSPDKCINPKCSLPRHHQSWCEPIAPAQQQDMLEVLREVRGDIQRGIDSFNAGYPRRAAIERASRKLTALIQQIERR